MASPVYLFTGFLDSGKSTLIKDTLSDPGFMDGTDNMMKISVKNTVCLQNTLILLMN